MERTFDRLGALDSFFLDTEHDDSPMHIGAVCLFENPDPSVRRVTLRKLRNHIETRLSLIPRYRQGIRRVPIEGHPVWVDSADFRIADHVHAIALPASSSAVHLEETVSWIFSRPLARNRPLWEIWLIEGLPDGGIALACKTHHCLADGLGGAALLCAILGSEPFPISDTPGSWRPRRPPSSFELLASAVDARARGAVALTAGLLTKGLLAPQAAMGGVSEALSALRSLVDVASRPPTMTTFDHPTGSDRRFLWWSVPLGDVKRIGRRLGGTVNDVALTLVSEAFARTTSASPSDGCLRVFCPVGNSAGVSTVALGNNVSGMFVDLPVEAPDLRSRWLRVVAAVRECKASGAVQGAFLLANLANRLGPTLLSRLEPLLGASQMFNLILTNVPGPQVPLYLFEQRLTSVCPFVPLFHGQGLGIALFSYAGTLTWGFHVDASRVDAARQLRMALAAALTRLMEVCDGDETVADAGEGWARPIGDEDAWPRDNIAAKQRDTSMPQAAHQGLHLPNGAVARAAG